MGGVGVDAGVAVCRRRRRLSAARAEQRACVSTGGGTASGGLAPMPSHPWLRTWRIGQLTRFSRRRSPRGGGLLGGGPWEGRQAREGAAARRRGAAVRRRSAALAADHACMHACMQGSSGPALHLGSTQAALQGARHWPRLRECRWTNGAVPRPWLGCAHSCCRPLLRSEACAWLEASAGAGRRRTRLQCRRGS